MLEEISVIFYGEHRLESSDEDIEVQDELNFSSAPDPGRRAEASARRPIAEEQGFAFPRAKFKSEHNSRRKVSSTSRKSSRRSRQIESHRSESTTAGGSRHRLRGPLSVRILRRLCG